MSLINISKLKIARKTFVIIASLTLVLASVDLTWAASNWFTKKVKLSTSSCTIHCCETKTISLKNLKNKSVSWRSSDNKIATVKKLGKTSATIQAKKSGKVTITARVNGKTYKCKVTIKKCSLVLKEHKDATHNTDGYNLYVCKYNKAHTKKTIIPKTVTVNYSRSAEAQGKTDGTVKIHFKNAADYKDCDTLVAYWADEAGILSEYKPVKKLSINGRDASWDMLNNRAIPENATKLRIYWTTSDQTSIETLSDSDKYSYCDLATNSATNAGTLRDSFWVYSDIHITKLDASGLGELEEDVSGNKHYIKALEDMRQVKPGIKHFIVGDITETGLESEFERFQEIVNESDSTSLKDIYIAIGNHDLFCYLINPTSGIKNYTSFAKSGEYVPDDLSNVYYHVKIKGIDHIILGGEKNKSDTVTPNLSTAQLDWFENEIEMASLASPDKPIFVYLHKNISINPTDDNAIRLVNILKKYPNVIMFSGHTHYELIHTSGLLFANQNEYGLPNEFDTSAVINQGRWPDPDGSKVIDKENAEGYLVEVYDNAVIIKGRSFIEHEFVTDAMYVINYNMY